MKIDPKVIELIIDENTDGSFANRRKAEIVKKKIRRLAREGRLDQRFIQNATDTQIEWAYRIFSASMMLGDYSWWGWETRSPWAWKLATGQWWYPQWDGRPCKLLVVAEQGLGDEIMFMSCAGELAAQAEVWWEIDDRLIPIAERSIPEVHWITRWKSDLREPWELRDHRGRYDAFIPAGNVAKLLRPSKTSFPRTPYLVPAEPTREISGVGYVDKSGAYLEKRENVTGDHDLHHYAPLYRSCKTLDEFMGLLPLLDYVVAVPSAVVHMCGAMGVPCDVVKPRKVIGQANTILKWYYGLNTRHMDWYGDHITVYQSSHDHHRRPRALSQGERARA